MIESGEVRSIVANRHPAIIATAAIGKPGGGLRGVDIRGLGELSVPARAILGNPVEVLQSGNLIGIGCAAIAIRRNGYLRRQNGETEDKNKHDKDVFHDKLLCSGESPNADSRSAGE